MISRYLSLNIGSRVVHLLTVHYYMLSDFLQGGVLSHLLFNTYVDCMIHKLENYV